MQSRSQERWLWSMLAAVVFLGITAGVCYWLKETEYQRRANAMEWCWSAEKATLDYCMKNNLHGYTMQAVPDHPELPRTLQVSVLDGGGVAYTFFASDRTTFVQIDDVLYVADFGPAGRRQIVAYDLKARKELWVCPLQGTQSAGYVPMSLGEPVPNTVNLEVDAGALLVFGSTRNHRYVEYVDPRSGKTIGYKQLPR